MLTFTPFSDNSTVSFILPDGQKCYVETMEILRVKCAGCGVTHGIAPVDLIPFCSFSLSAFLLLASGIFLNDKAVRRRSPVIHESEFISWHVLKRILLTYTEYHDRMMAALRMSGLHQSAADLADADLITSYNEKPPPCPGHKAFLRIHKWPVFVHRRNTVSYPLRFLLPMTLS